MTNAAQEVLVNELSGELVSAIREEGPWPAMDSFLEIDKEYRPEVFTRAEDSLDAIADHDLEEIRRLAT